MSVRGYVWYLLKTARISGWVLLVLTSIVIVTGFSLCGQYGVEKLIDTQMALTIHQIFDLPLVFVFLVHSAASVYLALLRWGWVKK